MSIALMTMARRTALPTNQKFALLALADWADDNGTSCWPSIYELSEYLTCSERTVQRLLRELEAGCWIVVSANANGGASSRHYCLNVPRMASESQAEQERRDIEKERRRRERKSVEANPFLEGRQSVTPDRLSPVTNQVEGVTSATAGVTNQVMRGDTGVTLSTIDPPDNHQITTIVGAAAPDKPKPSRATVLPLGFMPDGTAEQIARDFGVDLNDQLAAFCDHHTAKGSTFKDWQAAFRTWLRNANRFGHRASAMTPSKRTPAAENFAAKDYGKGVMPL